MAQNLVIVESTAKTKTIKKFLGKNYIVLSSVGHLKDLPKGNLGVEIDDNFEPTYITIRGKGKILNDLKKAAAESDAVFIATDPDREGEAIAWHINEEIRSKNSNTYRIQFNEITQTAVLNAIQNPMAIDEKRVEAQKARRVLDRLVGYQISPILWKTIFRGLSAGRVQSVALRLIIERETEIENFVSVEYWTITAQVQGNNTKPFYSKLFKIQGNKPEIPDKDRCDQILADLKTKNYVVKDISKKEVSRKPAPPFTTSTMQQEAAKRLGYSTKKIMMIAQQLYEGIEIGSEGSIGLITYMRTDSTRIANEAVQSAREYIYSAYGKDYLPDSPNIYKAKKNIQDAHEAIRPTSMHRDPKSLKKFLTAEQFKLYELIWNRFIACQMKPAKLHQTTLDIAAGDSSDKERYIFRTTGSVVIFRGFLQVYEDYLEPNGDDDSTDNQPNLPENLVIGQKLELLDLISDQHFTKPPARYSESSLVKELDNLGIGRPSTYSLIISTLMLRKYIERNNKQLVPTDLGRTVNKILVLNFPDLFNVKFTAKMEAELDKIESGDLKYLAVMHDFYKPLSAALHRVEQEKEIIKESLIEETDEMCPKCGSKLIARWGRNGKFIGCSAYPDCKYTRPLEAEQVVQDEICEKCGRPMVIKVGRFGRFLACSGYPECNNAKPYSLRVPCPKPDCDGEVIERKSKRGKVFYGCSNYPNCDFVTWYKPVAKKCPNCQSPYLEERYSQRDGEYLYCPKCKTKYEKETSEETLTIID
ncbi:type I DNA topoisomerase [candidate division KSB1 bacterium]|nr:type I DNA topoisomerase [candidate division KSB1 bacterium]